MIMQLNIGFWMVVLALGVVALLLYFFKQNVLRNLALAFERQQQSLLALNVREELAMHAQLARTELNQNFSHFQQLVQTQFTSQTTMQSNRLDGFAQQLEKLLVQNYQQSEQLIVQLNQQAQQARDELNAAFKQINSHLVEQLSQMTAMNDRWIAEVRQTLEQKLQAIEQNNAQKLDEMRKTVDEKLHATLEQRLGESFKLVSERLELVHRGLGEMQVLATGVGDLKRVLTNVKSRGTWGEVQLAFLLEQMLTINQYEKNVAVVPNSLERVEFAIKLPGRDGVFERNREQPVWLPIDAKFPREDYERLVDAQEKGDVLAVEEAAKALELRVKSEAKTISKKYLAPPFTTDFAILFLPTEGLYAEVLRRPGLFDFLQREFRVTVTGPTTLSALLNSLQMGFKTLAIEKRSSEVWQVLAAVKTEFGKFGGVLAKTKEQLERAARSISDAEQRTRVMDRKLKTVEALPETEAEQLLKEDFSEK